MTDLVTGNPLSLNSLVESLKEVMRAAPDKRTGKNCVYTMEDAALAAFAVFTTQSPSFLAYQRTMEQTRGQSNAQTLFGMSQIPTDNWLYPDLPTTKTLRFPSFIVFSQALTAYTNRKESAQGYRGRQSSGRSGQQRAQGRGIPRPGSSRS